MVESSFAFAPHVFCGTGAEQHPDDDQHKSGQMPGRDGFTQDDAGADQGEQRVEVHEDCSFGRAGLAHREIIQHMANGGPEHCGEKECDPERRGNRSERTDFPRFLDQCKDKQDQ